ncbi:helix-turn-helix domain-containing protein [Nocardioides baekrokdamisoli]|uniref:helix-turn-helix domain-containing protein n=1 Tax=Nocardioides baekrokdamisoli TaxID=1804624 RepID=UPI0022B2624E|nr:XRE family transcriptional regulator [Nocardioides baekrokdamisoli]
MDRVSIGKRLAEARDAAGMTQDSVARAVGLERTAIVLLEKGDRNLKVPELVQIAQVLGRPLSYFVETPVPAAVSRRSAPSLAHASTRVLDIEIDQFALDVRALVRLGLLSGAERDARARVPRSHRAAEDAATSFRRRLGLDSQSPVLNLGRVCETAGLYTFAAALGESGPDGACIEVADDSGTVGAAVINGDAGSGRRRMTLAHELGHWLFGDAYDHGASRDSERMISSFAVHFLAPRAGVQKVWSENSNSPIRDRALAVGVEFQLSWSATVGQLMNLALISHAQHDDLKLREPRAGDYLRLGLSWVEELEAPYLSPGFMAACLTGYTEEKLTEARVLGLLRGRLDASQLPQIEARSLEDLRQAFMGHGG